MTAPSAEKHLKAAITEYQVMEKFGGIRKDEKSESWTGLEQWNSG
jgi:hypothetical protein